MGFKEEVTEILRMAPKKRQTMLFRCVGVGVKVGCRCVFVHARCVCVCICFHECVLCLCVCLFLCTH